MALSQIFSGISEGVLDLIYPTLCLGCDQRGEWFCMDCTKQSALTRELDHCQLCNRITSTPGALCSLDRKALGLTGLVSFGDYRSQPLRKAIRAIKFEGIFSGIPGLVAAGQTRYQPVLAQKQWTALIPIPLSRKRLRERGFNQAELVAQAVARQYLSASTTDKNPPQSPFGKGGGTGVPLFQKEGLGEIFGGKSNVKGQLSKVSTNLIRTRDTQHQTELGRKERQENIENAFAWHGPRLQGSVLLVDDVVTTGATLAEAARILRHAGAHEVWGLTLAYET